MQLTIPLTFPDLFNDVHTDYSDRYDSEGYNALMEFKKNPLGQFKWKVISATQLDYVWSNYVKYGFVRSENPLNDIRESVLNGITRLAFVTELFGHTERCPQDVLEQVGVELTDEELDLTGEFFVDDTGNWTISDYGLPQLLKLYPDIYISKNTDLVYHIDCALNIIHQRSDLAALFVEGGSKTLTSIFLK